MSLLYSFTVEVFVNINLILRSNYTYATHTLNVVLNLKGNCQPSDFLKNTNKTIIIIDLKLKYNF